MNTLLVADPAARALESKSFLVRHGLTKWDGLGLTTCCLLLVAFAPSLTFSTWTPRMALILAVGPVGLYTLARFVRDRDVSAGLLAGALLWAVISAVASDAPRSALLGFAGRDLSVLTVSFSASLWAVGRTMSTQGRDLLVPVYVWSAVFNGLIGVSQVTLGVTSGPLRVVGGRATGLLINPVYFGAVCAAGLAMAAHVYARRSATLYMIPIAVLGVATSLSGSRVAVGAAVVVAVALCVVFRERHAVAASMATALALVLGVLLDRLTGTTSTASERIGTVEGGGRSTVWRYGLEAWRDAPVSGYGFGRFRPAVQGRFSAEFVRDFAPDDLTQSWFDAHNIVIGLLVAVGLVGTVLFGAWAVAWARYARGTLAWGLVPLLLHWLLQPVSLFTLPITMLLFGAAGQVARKDRTLRASRTTNGLLLALGVSLGSTLLLLDLGLRSAANQSDGDLAASMSIGFVRDPVVADVVAQIYDFDLEAADRGENVLRWRTKATEYEPDRPRWWSLLATQQIASRDPDAAEQALARAYELQPNNIRTIQAEGLLAVATDDEERLTAVFERLCALDDRACELRPADFLERDRP